MPYPYNQSKNTFNVNLQQLAITSGTARTALQIITPALSTGVTVRVFLRASISVGTGTGDITLVMRENPTSTTGTNPPAVVSCTDRRVSATTPQTLLYRDGGTSTGGVLIDQYVTYANIPTPAPMYTIPKTEMILKAGTKYTIAVTNGSGASINFFYTMGFREETTVTND